MIKSQLIAAILDLNPDATGLMRMLKADLESTLSNLQEARARELALPVNVAVRSRQEVFDQAWKNRIATAVSMGRKIRGRIVDVIERTPHVSSGSRVCYVIEHQEELITKLGDNTWEPARRVRTMHSSSLVTIS